MLFADIKWSMMANFSTIKNNAVSKQNECVGFAISINIQNNAYETILYGYQTFIDKRPYQREAFREPKLNQKD